MDTRRRSDVNPPIRRDTRLEPGDLAEAIAGEEVLDGYVKFVDDKTEWTGTVMTFDISKDGGKTEVRFTHQGHNRQG